MEEPLKPQGENVLTDQEARMRLKQARVALGMHPDELARHVYNSTSAYYDLENCEGELFTNIDLGELSKLCVELGTNSRALFGFEASTNTITPEELCQRIQRHLATEKLSLEVFEERVIYTVTSTLERPSEILAWNIDCLRNVCCEIGVNWIEALPG